MFKKTTESILSVFTKTIAELEKHVTSQESEHSRLYQQVSELAAKQATIRADVSKAEKALNKLKTFLED